MKARHGFVSNSSSTCFILDLSNSEAKRLVDKAVEYGIREPYGVGRGSAVIVGERAIKYAKELQKHEWGAGELGDWILEHTQSINKDDLAFVRSSDEGMGGYVPNLKRIQELAVSGKEYH